MSNFRYTRLALARFFTLLAYHALPDGEANATILICKADLTLKGRIAEVRAKAEAR